MVHRCMWYAMQVCSTDFLAVARGLSSCGAQALLVSQKGSNPVPCIARQIIHHWSIREVPELGLLLFVPSEVCPLSISFSVIFCSAIMRS